ncbi:AAA family ATPase [Weissella tructae]|uniref:AAA family ATPase n=1 Tax=Weissella tructae TaxID=887702 RepID=UPI001BDC5156|nr:AAA family ATPase [Weissella tructae]QVV90849.1 AAA family ATPase [Weissella tructae]
MPKYFKEGTIPKIGGMYFLYGGKGTQKTRTIKQFDGLKLVFSFDGSYSSLSDTNDVRLVAYLEEDARRIQGQIRYDLDQNLYVLDEQGKHIVNPEIKAVIFDNVSNLQTWVFNNIEDASKNGQMNWNKAQSWFDTLGSELRDLGIPVLATAHEKEKAVPGFYKPDLNDTLRNRFVGRFDVLGRIYKENGTLMVDVDPEKGNEGANRLDTRTNFKLEDLLQNETTQTETKEEGN